MNLSDILNLYFLNSILIIYMNKILLLYLLLLTIVSSQQCLNADGNPVTWWVQLVFPEDVPGGYAYIDDTFTNSDF